MDIPEFLSYDPSISAEARAVGRGVEDTQQDIEREQKRNKQDLKTTLKDIAVDLRRGKTDLRRQKTRGLEDLTTDFERGASDLNTSITRGLDEFSEQRADVQLEAKRGFEDFDTQLNNLIRSYQTLAGVQGEAANAAGVGLGGTGAAAAGKRAENLAVERQPIDVGRQRLGEDLASALGEIGETETEFRADAYTQGVRLNEDFGTGTGRLRQDFRSGMNRLKQDTRHDRRLTRRDYRRSEADLRRELQRALREGLITQEDLLEQAVFQSKYF